MCSSVFETFREFTLEIFGLRIFGFVLWFTLKLRKTFSMPKAKSVTWTREHFLIALNLYCKLPFGQYDRKNPIIIDVASRLGRTPSSLAMKLSNFASLDPIHQARGVKGLSGATKQDRVMWNEFRSDIEVLGAESEQLLHDLYTEDNDEEVDFLQRDNVRLEHSSVFLDLSRETEVVTVVKVRRGQQFFRQTVLNAYGIRCCITGIKRSSFARRQSYQALARLSERAPSTAKWSLSFKSS